MTKGPADIDVQPKIPIQLLELRSKLPNKIHRRSRDTRLRSDWRVVGYLSSANDPWQIKRNGNVTVGVVRRCRGLGTLAGRAGASSLPRLRDASLIKLDLVDLERVVFRTHDGMKIHVAGGEKNNRHIKAVGRIGRIDVCLDGLQISIAPLLQREVQFPRVLPRSDGLGNRRFRA